MPKNIEDMIVPERKRSIRDIPIPKGRRRTNRSTPSIPPKEQPSLEVKHDDFHIEGYRRRLSVVPRKGVWISAGIAILILLFAILSLFNGSTLSYVPKSTALSFNNDVYSAWKSKEGQLLYSVIKLSEDKGLEVAASGEKEVSRKAGGKIIVYNTSNQSQKLRATTRFETPDQKIYRVEDAIVIPAKKIVGGVDKPGSLEITVFAESPGDEYNTGLTDFTLPGLEGTSLFTSIYARSKTVISGGFVGMERAVSREDQTNTEIQLAATLRDELISKATVQVPEGFILLPSLSSVTFENLPQTNSGSKNKTTVNIRGNLYGVMFKKGDLSSYLAMNKITLRTDELVDIDGLELLDFSFATTTTANSLYLQDEISFFVTGNAVAVWRTDEIALKTNLVKRNKRDIPSILNSYPTIISATVTIRPFWKRTFPDDSTRISIKKLPVK